MASWKNFVKAAVYGIGTAVITLGIANDRAQADALVSRLEQYKQQQGTYPEKLDDLVPTILPYIQSIGLGRPIYGKEADSYTLTTGMPGKVAVPIGLRRVFGHAVECDRTWTSLGITALLYDTSRGGNGAVCSPAGTRIAGGAAQGRSETFDLTPTVRSSRDT